MNIKNSSKLFMELPSPLSLSFFSSSSSSSSPSSSSSSSSANILAANALLQKSCNEQSALSDTNVTCTTNVSNHHQFSQNFMIQQVYDAQAAGSKKRKLASANWEQDEEDAAHTSTTFSAQHTEDHQDCCDVNTIKDDEILCHEEEEERLVGYTTPPHVQTTAGDHDCNMREIKESEELQLNMDTDLAELDAPAANASAVRHYKGSDQITLDSAGGDNGRLRCGCSSMGIVRGPPPPPRKPKPKPRILKFNPLNFFIPPDLDLFFSSTSSSINTYCKHDAA